MKKIIAIASMSTFLIACGGGPATPCDCAEALGEMNTAYEEARGDDAKQKELKEKFEKLNKDCEALSEKMGEEKFQKEIEVCLENMEK